MKDPRTYLTNYTAASTGFSIGKLKDDPGDGSGSGITVQTHNDFLYGLFAIVKTWLGSVSGTDESELASDVRTAMHRASGIENENVSAWDNSTTYGQDDHVMYLGIQFVSMKGSNIGNNPMDTPLYWLPCYGREEAFRMFHEGIDIHGGFAPLHNIRDTSNYREFFQWGKYNFGGDSGRNFQAYGVHLSGQVLTGDTDYETIFNIGEADEYPLLDIIAPEIGGLRTILDSKGRVPRCVDATSGNSVDVGLSQEDAMQRITGDFSVDRFGYFGGVSPVYAGSLSRSTSSTSRNVPASSGSSETNMGIKFDSADSTSPNVAKTNDSETRMKNYSVGLRSILVMIEI